MAYFRYRAPTVCVTFLFVQKIRKSYAKLKYQLLIKMSIFESVIRASIHVWSVTHQSRERDKTVCTVIPVGPRLDTSSIKLLFFSLVYRIVDIDKRAPVGTVSAPRAGKAC
jgi:hypothetical protein